MSRSPILCAAFGLAILPMFTLAAAASTLAESSLSGQDFSGNWTSFSVIDTGATTVTGTWSGGNDADYIAFTGLAKGAQQVVLTFSPIGPQGDSFSAGGSVLWKTTPLQHSEWEGERLGEIGFWKSNQSTPQTLTIALNEAFGGSLYLQLFGTHGTLQYGISAPGNALASPPVTATPEDLVAAVPLPAAAMMLLAGLGALLSLGARRRRV